MDINFKDLWELARKAALFDGIINYVKSNRYLSRGDILCFVGESEPTENTPEDGDENVLRF